MASPAPPQTYFTKMRHLGVPREGGPGRLPRTSFIDDPFFHDSFGGFSRSPNTQRRFGGSTPRLFDDENDFFDDFHNKIPFGSSLPRRQQSRSPNLTRHEPKMDYQNDRQERNIPVQRMSPNNSTMPPMGPNQIPKKNPLPKPVVEINNAQSNYTNGELNPDRYQQPPVSDCPNPIIIKEVSLDDTKTKIEKKNSNELNQNDEKIPIPLPAPISMTEKNVKEKPILNGTTIEIKRQIFSDDKKISIDSTAHEKLINLLDEAEKRVEQMREAAYQLEQEKDTLLELISSVKVNAELMSLGTNDREDIDATSERILTRCKAVNVSVFTPRNEEQSKALNEVNKLIENVTSKMNEDFEQTRETITRFLNACCPDDEPGPIDERFQSKVIECTADDQKKIRRKLKQIIEQIDRANFVYNQNNFHESNA